MRAQVGTNLFMTFPLNTTGNQTSIACTDWVVISLTSLVPDCDGSRWPVVTPTDTGVGGYLMAGRGLPVEYP
jgi:hypothetical protein